MSLIDREEFEKAKRAAAEEWRGRGEPRTAAAFEAMVFERCGFGMDPRLRSCFQEVDGLRVVLGFSLETGAYERSWVYRGPGPG